jgi:hypothetical protein
MEDLQKPTPAAVAAIEVDWDLAPAHARWWAVDEDGKAHWYCAPNTSHLSSFWFADQIAAPTFGFAGDWRESLVERRTHLSGGCV